MLLCFMRTKRGGPPVWFAYRDNSEIFAKPFWKPNLLVCTYLPVNPSIVLLFKSFRIFKNSSNNGRRLNGQRNMQLAGCRTTHRQMS